MAPRASKKNEQKTPQTPMTGETMPLLEEHKEPVKHHRLSRSIPRFSWLTTLLKLRIVITTLFLFLTLAFLLIFMNGYVISAVLLLFSYVLMFLLMIKLFMVKNL